LIQRNVLPEGRIVGVETGGCPHSAIREDISMNLEAIAKLNEQFKDADIVLVESGGDNLTAVFSPELADFSIFVISVAEGEDIPRKGGPGISKSDLLVINKKDLAVYVNADLGRMDSDTRQARKDLPYLFTDMMHDEGTDEIVQAILEAKEKFDRQHGA
jgi:urease accessory protein